MFYTVMDCSPKPRDKHRLEYCKSRCEFIMNHGKTQIWTLTQHTVSLKDYRDETVGGQILQIIQGEKKNAQQKHLHWALGQMRDTSVPFLQVKDEVGNKAVFDDQDCAYQKQCHLVEEAQCIMEKSGMGNHDSAKIYQ